MLYSLNPHICTCDLLYNERNHKVDAVIYCTLNEIWHTRGTELLNISIDAPFIGEDSIVLIIYYSVTYFIPYFAGAMILSLWSNNREKKWIFLTSHQASRYIYLMFRSKMHRAVQTIYSKISFISLARNQPILYAQRSPDFLATPLPCALSCPSCYLVFYIKRYLRVMSVFACLLVQKFQNVDKVSSLADNRGGNQDGG